jgi:hypothetical protein
MSDFELRGVDWGDDENGASLRCVQCGKDIGEVASLADANEAAAEHACDPDRVLRLLAELHYAEEAAAERERSRREYVERQHGPMADVRRRTAVQRYQEWAAARPTEGWGRRT